MILDKKIFYKQLKSYTNKYIPIFIIMPIKEKSKYKIILDECRTTNDKIKLDFLLQIIDSTKSGFEKYMCKDISFNLINENIRSDYQLYKFINRKIEELNLNDI